MTTIFEHPMLEGGRVTTWVIEKRCFYNRLEPHPFAIHIKSCFRNSSTFPSSNTRMPYFPKSTPFAPYFEM